MRDPRRAGALAAALLAAVAAAGCGSTPGASNNTTSSTSTGTTSASTVQTTGFSKLGNITLKVWSADNQDPGPEPVIKELTNEFMAKYPNVKVVLTFKGFTDYIKVVKLALASGSGPDVAEGNQGYQIDGSMVKAGLILPLTPYVKAYGWDKWYSPSTFQQFQWTNDGKTFGQGTVWGVAQFGQSTGIFANTAKLKSMGLSTTPPTSFAAFEQLLAKVRAKLPASQPVINLGNKDGYEVVHLWGMIDGNYASAQEARNWIFHKAGATFATPGNIQALTTLKQWAAANYFGQNYNALGENDAAAQFGKGTGVFYMGGNWQAAVIQAGLKNNVEFYNMPPGKSGKEAAIGATSLPWHISAKTKYPDVAAAYINFLINSPNAASQMYKQSQIPSVETAPAAQGDQYLTSIAQGWQRLVKDDGLELFPDWSSPSMFDTMGAAFQKLLVGQSTPQQVAATMQADWVKYDKTLH
jgi:raffinose/stachyose/melibiose transport system substrate-binding protein